MGFNAHAIYNDRVKEGNKFVGTYEVSIGRMKDYNEFIDYARNEMSKHQNRMKQPVFDKMNKLWDKGLLENDYNRFYEIRDRRVAKNIKECKCMLCKPYDLRLPTFEEWKTGKYSDNKGRMVKLGKTLRKMGFSQTLIDFYSLQSKSELTAYFTISDRVQHLAGISYYAEIDTWDGYNGTSCQDPRHDYDEIPKLGGTIYDNKLYVGMLHYELEDIEDMTDKLVARTIMRLVHVDGIPCMVSTTFYGNNDTKSMLGNALDKLSMYDIYNKRNGDGATEYVEEEANGCYEHTTTVYEYLSMTVDEYVNVTCPLCDGSGHYEMYSCQVDKHIEIECPCCNGNGYKDVNVYEDIEEEVESEESMNIYPYVEGYSHYGYKISISIPIEHIRDMRAVYNPILEEEKIEEEEEDFDTLEDIEDEILDLLQF